MKIEQLQKLAKSRKYDAYQRTLASMVYTFFWQENRIESKCKWTTIAEELHKPVIKKFKKRKVYARFKDNIWAADLAEMGPLSSKNKDVQYFLCDIDLFTKYAWVKHLKEERDKIVLNVFIEIVSESNSKPNNLWVEQEIEFCNKLMQKWLDSNSILMYLTHIEGKSVPAVRFIKH